jgi:hypothetical protein
MGHYLTFILPWAIEGFCGWLVWCVGLGIWVALMGDINWRALLLVTLGGFVGLMVYIGTAIYVGTRTPGGWEASMAVIAAPFVILWVWGKLEASARRKQKASKKP